MTILLTEESRVLVQGVTGRIGEFHTEEMLAYGTQVVGGVTPGKDGETVLGVRVFDTVKDAVAQTGADASIVFVPPPFTADAIMEAADAGIRYCVCITDGIPTQDMMRVKRYLLRYLLRGPDAADRPELRRNQWAQAEGHAHQPFQQFNSLSPAARRAVMGAPAEIQQDPTGRRTYNKKADTYAADFHNGDIVGVIVYAIAEQQLKVPILHISTIT